MPNDLGSHKWEEAAAAYEESLKSAAADDRPPAFTDEALAQRFSAEHETNLRYLAAWGRWLIWNGTVWRFDETLEQRFAVYYKQRLAYQQRARLEQEMVQ